MAGVDTPVQQAWGHELNVNADDMLVTAGQMMTTSSQGRAPLPARRDRQARAALAVRWIGAGEAIDVHGFKMSGGLLYIGSVRPVTLCDRDRRQVHVIDPAARIDPRLANVAGQTMSYWPSYAEIGPAPRRVHLQ